VEFKPGIGVGVIVSSPNAAFEFCVGGMYVTHGAQHEPDGIFRGSLRVPAGSIDDGYARSGRGIERNVHRATAADSDQFQIRAGSECARCERCHLGYGDVYFVKSIDELVHVAAGFTYVLNGAEWFYWPREVKLTELQAGDFSAAGRAFFGCTTDGINK